MDKRLDNKISVVTGASRGIGASVATLFASLRSKVFLLARDATALEEVTERINESGGDATPLTCDISSKIQVSDAFERIGNHADRIDILVNSAAVLEKKLMEELDEETFQKILKINVNGAFLCCRAALQYMKDNGGSIINISSLSGVVGVEKFAGMGAYVISKYGLWGLTEILAVEWAKYGIRVNAISPSGVDTEMFQTAFPGAEAPMSPKDIAKVCLFLASDDSQAITGENIIVKGI
ncbi:MAG: SDR family oxidoreductase [candidate division Zixibacteria bacterium]|nr:SDR family oxidoreductase [candidate division Zixibacteria bacterium]